MRTQLKFVTIFLILTVLISFTACEPVVNSNETSTVINGGSGVSVDSTITVNIIPGIPCPAIGETPVTTITETAQYTGTVTWSGSPLSFEVSTPYTASINLTPKAGFTLSGVSENFFTVWNADTVLNTVDSGVITAVFPAIDAPPVNVSFSGVTQVAGTSNTVTTTSLILNFDVDPTTLTADNITIKGATKGILSGTGTETTRNLTISDIMVGDGQTISVSITNPTGYSISNSTQTALVYRWVYDFSSISKRELVSITGGTFNQKATIGTPDNFNHTLSDYTMAKYELTYELWYTVYQWAISNGYSFANAGKEGHDGIEGAAPTAAKYEPVTTLDWSDAIIWLNAYSYMSGLTPVYTYESVMIKDSRDSNISVCYDATCDWTANGYRLPTEGEWQFAASNKGATPYNYASGATAYYNNSTETKKVAWYSSNSGGSTKPVGTTTNSNALTLWDMSGNVYEWCWDRSGYYPGTSIDYKGPTSGESRIFRGGGWAPNVSDLQIGARNFLNPYVGYSEYIGIRITRNS